MNQLERIQRSLTKKSAPRFEIGDTVRVHVKVGAKLYYLRGKKGKFAKVEEREFVGESKSSAQSPAAEAETVTAS
ncbi:MAG: hypothetical protein HZC50_01955 [Nitrospirae bacterium]|nr:hypothetical protein [Nitrospirota bacterium]